MGMTAETATLAIFAAAIAFLGWSVFYNKRTGWRRPARRDEVHDLLSWCADVKQMASSPEDGACDITQGVLPTVVTTGRLTGVGLRTNLFT